TVSDLQIFYFQKDPSSWLAKSSIVLDQSNADISKFLEQSTKSTNNASTVSAIVTIGGTLFAVVAGILIALWTAKSITEPLNHLMTVTREIGDSGDLDQNIDRKSTRLNSSHQIISYAVFCLKKTKKPKST